MIVVDASLIADALIDDGRMGDAARHALMDDSHWAAPAHLAVEVLSVIRGKVLGGKLNPVAAAESLGCPLVTCDGRLAKAAGSRCEIRVVR